MRSEKEMIDLILDTARKDERIRAVYMNGSRTNPNAPKDLFQDYDIVYVVRETLPFIKDTTWIDRFGERLYMQLPEQTGLLLGYEADLANCYGWLMQFTDGNRIDLHVQSIPYAQQAIRTDRLCKILLDKDGLLPAMPAPTDADFWVKKPDSAHFLAVCNAGRIPICLQRILVVPKQRRQRALAGGNPLRAGDAPRCGTPAAGADACLEDWIGT